MPQMSPLSWLNLFTSFITIFMLMNCLNYFSFNYKKTSTLSLPKKPLTNWKW